MKAFIAWLREIWAEIREALFPSQSLSDVAFPANKIERKKAPSPDAPKKATKKRARKSAARAHKSAKEAAKPTAPPRRRS